jgi:transposase-like protein
VIQEAYVHGVSTRKVDDIVTALGMTGVSEVAGRNRTAG